MSLAMIGNGSHASDEREAALTDAITAAMALFHETALEALPPSHRMAMTEQNVWASALSACVQGAIGAMPEPPQGRDASMIAYSLGAAFGAFFGHEPGSMATQAFANGLRNAADALSARAGRG